MNFTATLERFGDLLAERLEHGTFTTEDSVRYTFFAAFLESGIKPHEVVLEYPHPAIPRAQIDTWFPDFGGKSLAIEFKYDRAIPSGGNSPRTQKAGKLFHDLYRLGLLARTSRSLFVYLTCQEMASYLGNPLNNLVDFFALSQGNSLHIGPEFMRNRPATFVRTAGEVPNVEIVCQHSRSLPGAHELRVLEVVASDR